MESKLIHPFKPIYDENSKILILGSFPSVISRTNNFYYGNLNNRFWKVLSILFKTDLLSLDNNKKKEFLLANNIALYDVIYSCNITNSSDASINNVTYANIPDIINKSKIKKIYLNGKKAYELFNKAFNKYNYEIEVLPSTSPANAAFSLDKLVLSYQSILEELK